MTVVAAERQPVSCTLSVGEFEDRTALIAELNRNALLSRSRDGLRLRSTYAGHAASAIDELVRRERDCCAFLAFNISQTGQSVTLTIDVPDKWRNAADVLLEPFMSTQGISGDVEACGCGPSGCGPSPAHADQRDERATKGLPGEKRAVRAAAVATATGALACAACCVVPLAVPAIALTGFGSVLAILGSMQAWLLGIAAATVAGGWFWLWRQSVREGKRPSRTTLVAMGTFTAVLLLTVGWPVVEARVLSLVS